MEFGRCQHGPLQATKYATDFHFYVFLGKNERGEAAGAERDFVQQRRVDVESYAEGAVARSAVAAFYAATLPQLGWRARQSNVFVREGERLSLIFLGGDGDLIVRFTLEPQ